MSYRYGHNWNTRLRQPIDEVDETTARRRFEEGPQVSVSRLADGAVVPDYTLVLGTAGSHVRVRLFDENGSIVESYDWAEVEGEDRLFLTDYWVWVYAEDATEPQTFSQSRANKAWLFRPDGTARSRESIKGHPEVRIREYQDMDMSGHWRDRPAFGEWDSFGELPEPGAGPASDPAG